MHKITYVRYFSSAFTPHTLESNSLDAMLNIPLFLITTDVARANSAKLFHSSTTRLNSTFRVIEQVWLCLRQLGAIGDFPPGFSLSPRPLYLPPPCTPTSLSFLYFC